MTSNLVIFDFCDTLIDFQSADAFVKYYKEIHGNLGLWSSLIDLVRKLLIKTRIINLIQLFDKESYVNKRLLLLELKGAKKSDIDSCAKRFFENIIMNHYIRPVVVELKQYQSEGWNLCICSGGYDAYLKYVQEYFKIDCLICTEIAYRNDRCVGKYKYVDCIGEAKLKLIKDRYGFDVFEKYETVVFSDSYSDLPLLKACKHGIVVCDGTIPGWVKDNNLEGIVCR